MSESSRDRQAWEYADGPDVGGQVSITSEPRAEDQPGVPAPVEAREQANGDRFAPNGAGTRQEREVRADDPDLSRDTNARLTAELREIVGADRVRVPADRPQASRGEHPQQHGPVAALNVHRFQIIRASAIVLTFAAVIALITNDWWLLPLAAGVHALGTMTVMLTVTRMTTVSEHPSAELAAALAEEGVANPDEYFSRMVEEFRPQPNEEAAEGGATEVISPGYNERDTPADTATAAASAEQSSAMTPTSQPSRPGGQGGAPELLIWSTAVSLLVLSIILPAAGGGGWLWLTTAVMVPLLIGWMVFQQLMITRRNQLHVQGRGPVVTIVLCTAIAVALFCAVVALGFQR